ncbi:MAG: hypothetical protein NXI31_04405 [bacterium]|nr:hypothetical protein [bacterium]
MTATPQTPQQQPRRKPRRLAKLILAGSTLLFAGLIGEAVLRVVGGFRLFSGRLETVVRATDANAMLTLAESVVMPFEARWRDRRTDLDVAWLRESPPPLPAPPALDRPTLPQHDWLFNYYTLNEVVLRSPLAKALLQDPKLSPPDEFAVFSPPGGKPAPHYRYPASRTLPTGLVTNRFGFRGREVDVDKPAKTVRIVFVGASTTVEAHHLPHSAPELVEHWLGLWAKARGLDVRFEVLNAAREAIRSHDIRAIVADEVLPLELDYLVYYEGANQFQPAVLQKHVAVDGDYELASPPPGIVGNYDDTETADSTWLDGLASYLATARYLRSALAGSEKLSEPQKPAQRITLPDEVLTGEFPLAQAGTVLDCAAIRGDLAAIKRLVEGADARLVLCTFWWLAEDGMLLDPVWAANVHVHLNRAYWPFSYAVIRELADVQNRFFRAWAKKNGVDLLDVGAELPQHEQLAIDAIHQNEVGVRLKAWVQFAGLTRILERDLAAGAVPRADAQPLSSHPNIGEVRTIPRAEVLGK